MKVGITHGDYNGINYELLLKVFEHPAMAEICTPVIYGSPKVAGWYRKTLNLPPVQLNVITEASQAKPNAVNIINVLGEGEPEVLPGKPSQQAGESARKALEQAVSDLKEGYIDVLVTAPINKNTVQSDSFHFPGHTEFLEERLGGENGSKALMIMCSDRLKVALVTTHLPLKDVAAHITKDDILGKLRLFHNSLEIDFSRPNAKIAVLTLNPHAGDNGVLGSEEQEIIKPAIEEACNEGILAFGPFAADGFFGSGNYSNFDGVLAMYHDQGLIPFKLLAMDDGINYTAGLPYVRTSPDHGTAYDIAGKGVAQPDSLRKAVYMAIDIAADRKRNEVLKDNPLPKLYNTAPGKGE